MKTFLVALALLFLPVSLLCQAPTTLQPGATLFLQGKQGVPGNPGAPGAAGKNGTTPTCSVGTATLGCVKVSVTPQCVFTFDSTACAPVATGTPVLTPAPTPPVTTAPVTGPSSPTSSAHQTWYVRPDGGNRYSTNVPTGQCDGLGDVGYAVALATAEQQSSGITVPVPGQVYNLHCAFNDVRLLWQDGSYAESFTDVPVSDGKTDHSFPARGWIGNGGDTYLIRGSISSGAKPYRIGWDWVTNCAGATQYPGAPVRGWCGNQTAGPPSPPAGAAGNPTRILGENYAACNAQSARTPLLPGWGIGAALAISNSYIDVECLDITDSSQLNGSYTGDDSATEGIAVANTADHFTLTNVRMHGLRTFGMLGSTGDGTVMDHVAWVGNGGGGWNADAGDGKTGVGSLLVTNFDIEWNGCAEMIGSTLALPYANCLDQNSGGYGDGFGTATVVTNGWHATFDTGTAAFNTQDGLDALHFVSNNGTSSFTVNNVQAYSNMGQQVKIGGDRGTISNSVITANCKAMAAAIPGTPAGYNAQLSDFCRASNTGAYISVNNGSTSAVTATRFYGAGTILLQVNCTTACDQPTTLLTVTGSTFNGSPRDDGQGLPAAFYFNGVGNALANSGSVNSGNVFNGVKPGTTYVTPEVIGAAVTVPVYGGVQ